MMARGTHILFMVAVLAAVGPAAAQTEDKVEQAGRCFDRAVARFDEGDLAGALASFEEANDWAPNVEVLFNMAIVRASLGQAAAASETFEQFLAHRDSEGHDELRRVARRELERLRPQVGQVEVVSEPAVDAALYLDGEPLGQLPRARPLWVTPGQYTVEVRADGFHRAQQQVAVAGGALVELRVRLIPEEPPPPVVNLQPEVPAVVADEGLVDPNCQGGYRLRRGGWLLGSFGALLVTTAFTLHLWNSLDRAERYRDQFSSLQQQYAAVGSNIGALTADQERSLAQGQRKNEELYASIRAWEIGYALFYGIGAVAVAAGIGLGLWGHHRSKRCSSVRVTPSPTGITVAWGGPLHCQRRSDAIVSH
jgi:tetratricopeptide (TPR) repeat protein